MIECKRFNASFLKPDTCIGKQAEIARLSTRVKESENGGKRIIGEESTRLTRALRCEGCETGLALYNKFLKGEIMETKTCPCGKEFARKPDQLQSAWSRTKYCPKHSDMDPYTRSKELMQIADAKAKTLDGPESGQTKDIAKPAIKKPATKPVAAPAPKHTPKPCIMEGCDNMVPWKDGYSPANYKSAKYCSDECRRKMERKRAKETGRNKRMRARPFDQELAEQIAREITEDSLRMIKPFVDDTSILDQIRGVAEQVGIRCQRRMNVA